MAIRIVMLCGPFIDNPEENRKKFEEAALPVWKAGFFAFNPIGNCFYMFGKVSEDVFKERDLWIVEKMDALLMLNGWNSSAGANREREHALKLGIPVFESLEELIAADKKPEKSILVEAHELSTVVRRATYSHPLDDYTATAKMWSGVLAMKLKQDLTPEEAILCMCCVKISRESRKHMRDSIVDLAGYANCLQMVIEERTKREKEKEDR